MSMRIHGTPPRGDGFHRRGDPPNGRFSHDAPAPMQDPERDVNGVTEALFVRVMDDLRHEARRLLQHQNSGHTLQTMDLVNEAYLKLKGGSGDLLDSNHCFALAARAMRQVLVDHARKRTTVKRKPPGERLPLDRVVLAYEAKAVDLLALNEALEELERADPVMVRVVEAYFFGGRTFEKIAPQVGMSTRNLRRKWDVTRAWLLSRVR